MSKIFPVFFFGVYQVVVDNDHSLRFFHCFCGVRRFFGEAFSREHHREHFGEIINCFEQFPRNKDNVEQKPEKPGFIFLFGASYVE